MGNINAPEIEYFESFANEIQSKFQRVKSLVSHRVTSGDYHEEVIRTILRNFLSKRYSVKKGFIYGGKNKVSNQIDIMIIDESSPVAYIFQEGDFAIVIPEAVVAVMEVKTTLNAQDFDVAIQNIASAKSLVEFRASFIGVVFGYQGTEPSDANLHTWFKRPTPSKFKNDINTKGDLYPNAIMFFSNGCLLSRFTEADKWELGGKYFRKAFRDKSARKSVNDIGWQLSIILAMIMNACERKEFASTGRLSDSKADRLLQSEGSMISHSKFIFGKGTV